MSVTTATALCRPHFCQPSDHPGCRYSGSGACGPVPQTAIATKTSSAQFQTIIAGSRRRACTTAAPSMTMIKPAVAAIRANKGGISSTTGRIIPRPPTSSVKATNRTLPELRSSTQPAPRSTSCSLDTTNFIAPTAAKAKPIPMLTTQKSTFTTTLLAVTQFNRHPNLAQPSPGWASKGTSRGPR